jgi:hypothetical protein
MNRPEQTGPNQSFFGTPFSAVFRRHRPTAVSYARAFTGRFRIVSGAVSNVPTSAKSPLAGFLHLVE